jgi:Ni,Fe-hydrogenase III large subunit
VLRLGEALRAEGIRFDPREIKDLGADPHLHEELASYMKQLGDVRRSLKTGAQNVLEGADLVNYTLVELDTALDGLEVTLPTSTGATSSGGFTGAGCAA